MSKQQATLSKQRSTLSKQHLTLLPQMATMSNDSVVKFRPFDIVAVVGNNVAGFGNNVAVFGNNVERNFVLSTLSTPLRSMGWRIGPIQKISALGSIRVGWTPARKERTNKRTPVVSFLPPGLPPLNIAWTASSELIGFCFYYSLFFVSVPCSRLSWPYQLVSTR